MSHGQHFHHASSNAGRSGVHSIVTQTSSASPDLGLSLPRITLTFSSSFDLLRRHRGRCAHFLSLPVSVCRVHCPCFHNSGLRHVQHVIRGLISYAPPAATNGVLSRLGCMTSKEATEAASMPPPPLLPLQQSRQSEDNGLDLFTLPTRT